MLDVLFGNPLILLIVIGLISALFRKRKEAEPVRPRRQGSGMPTFTNEEPQPSRELDHWETEAYDVEPENKYMEALQAYESEGATQPVPDSKPLRPYRIRPESASPVRITAEHRPSADDARLGMMWSEVFGPPRAKRPYRR